MILRRALAHPAVPGTGNPTVVALRFAAPPVLDEIRLAGGAGRSNGIAGDGVRRGSACRLAVAATRDPVLARPGSTTPVRAEVDLTRRTTRIIRIRIRLVDTLRPVVELVRIRARPARTIRPLTMWTITLGAGRPRSGPAAIARTTSQSRVRGPHRTRTTCQGRVRGPHRARTPRIRTTRTGHRRGVGGALSPNPIPPPRTGRTANRTRQPPAIRSAATNPNHRDHRTAPNHRGPASPGSASGEPDQPAVAPLPAIAGSTRARMPGLARINCHECITLWNCSGFVDSFG